MSHSKNCETHAIEFFGWFADVYRAFRQIFWLPMLTGKRLRKVLSYVPTTGIFRWKVSAGSRAPVGAMPAQKMGGVTIKFALVVSLIRQVALLGSI
jgi:hypothetical protein